jgi:hypothetical protein
MRVHVQISCERCGMKFRTERDLNSHLRADVVCQVQPRSVDCDSPWLDKDVLWQLRSRNKRGSTEEEKWAYIYGIVFPDTNKDRIPSPCESQHSYCLFLSLYIYIYIYHTSPSCADCLKQIPTIMTSNRMMLRNSSATS